MLRERPQALLARLLAQWGAADGTPQHVAALLGCDLVSVAPSKICEYVAEQGTQPANICHSWAAANVDAAQGFCDVLPAMLAVPQTCFWWHGVQTGLGAGIYAASDSGRCAFVPVMKPGVCDVNAGGRRTEGMHRAPVAGTERRASHTRAQRPGTAGTAIDNGCSCATCQAAAELCIHVPPLLCRAPLACPQAPLNACKQASGEAAVTAEAASAEPEEATAAAAQGSEAASRAAHPGRCRAASAVGGGRAEAARVRAVRAAGGLRRCPRSRAAFFWRCCSAAAASPRALPPVLVSAPDANRCRPAPLCLQQNFLQK